MSAENPAYRKDGEIDGRSIRDPKTRPQKPIDWKRVDELLMAGCLGTEIAANFDMHPNTFYDRVVQKYNMSFTEYSSEKRCKGDSILREVQYLKAIGLSDLGDNTLLIWLGKHRLEQKENAQDWNAPKQETQVTIANMKEANGQNSPQSQTATQSEGSNSKA